MVLVYDITRHFGSSAQAGFGIGVRVVQALLLVALNLWLLELEFRRKLQFVVTAEAATLAPSA